MTDPDRTPHTDSDDPAGGAAALPQDVPSSLLDGGATGDPSEAKQKMARAAQQGDARLRAGEQGADVDSDALDVGDPDAAPQTGSASRGGSAASGGAAASPGGAPV